MPTRRAPRASQLSRVSFQPRGPETSQSINRALTDALTADFSLNSERLFGYATIDSSTVLGMTKPIPEETWKPLWVVLRRVLGGLSAQKHASEKKAARPVESDRAASGPTGGSLAEQKGGEPTRVGTRGGFGSPAAGLDDLGDVRRGSLGIEFAIGGSPRCAGRAVGLAAWEFGAAGPPAGFWWRRHGDPRPNSSARQRSCRAK